MYLGQECHHLWKTAYPLYPREVAGGTPRLLVAAGVGTLGILLEGRCMGTNIQCNLA